MDLSHVPPADLPVVFKTVLHPAESGEFLSGLGAMLRSRAAREEHLRWQRQRALYPQCMQLASVESRGPLMRLGLDAVLDVTSAAGGAVLRLGESGVSIECLSGLENVRIEKTLDHVRDHLSEDAPRVEWIPLPSNYTKGRRNSLGPQAVVLPLTRVNGKLLWVLVFPGKPTRWRENKLQDVRLILTHLRMASMRIDSVEAGAKAEVRDPWTGLLREEPLLMSMRQRLRDRSSGGLDASARRGEGKAGVSKERVLSLALVVADLDGFTQLNRSEGHLRGGLLIRRLAQRFLQIVANRGILARTGPDEFAVVVDESREVDKELLAQEIWQGVREAPFCLGGGERKKKQHLTVAVGYSAAKGRKVDPSGLLHNARDAVKQAKREGGDRVVGFEGGVRPGWR